MSDITIKNKVPTYEDLKFILDALNLPKCQYDIVHNALLWRPQTHGSWLWIRDLPLRYEFVKIVRWNSDIFDVNYNYTEKVKPLYGRIAWIDMGRALKRLANSITNKSIADFSENEIKIKRFEGSVYQRIGSRYGGLIFTKRLTEKVEDAIENAVERIETLESSTDDKLIETNYKPIGGDKELGDDIFIAFCLFDDSIFKDFIKNYKMYSPKLEYFLTK